MMRPVVQRGGGHRVTIVEVGPRDGLQFEARQLTTTQKVDLIRRLGAAGLRAIEIGSYVSPSAVPAMADTPAVVAALTPGPAGVTYSVLTPTVKFLQPALEAGVRRVAVFVGASDAFNQRNIRMTTVEALDAARAVAGQARAAGATVRGYVSVCWGMQAAGDVPVEAVVHVASALLAMGCDEIALGDTVGVATPETVVSLLAAVRGAVPLHQLAVHLHDRDGHGVTNVLAAVRAGVTTVDAAVARLGGCLASGALTANVATEAVVDALEDAGYATGVHRADIHAIAANVRAMLAAAGDPSLRSG